MPVKKKSVKKKTVSKTVSSRPQSRKTEDTTLPVLTHVLGILTSFIGPLIIYLVSEDANAKRHSKAALNWQISLLIYFAVSFVLWFILIGIPLTIALSVLNIVFGIMAAMKASNGEFWKYPLSIPFFKI
jgi:uncharacterized Tic20 family protein